MKPNNYPAGWPEPVELGEAYIDYATQLKEYSKRGIASRWPGGGISLELVGVDEMGRVFDDVYNPALIPLFTVLCFGGLFGYTDGEYWWEDDGMTTTHEWSCLKTPHDPDYPYFPPPNKYEITDLIGKFAE